MNLPETPKRLKRWLLKCAVSIKKFSFAHKICILCSLVGLVVGPAFFVGGFIAGFFGDFIYEKISDEKKLRAIFEEGKFSASVDEPFPGCLVSCALGVYSLGDFDSCANLAGAAGSPESLNGDLLAETLASKIMHDEFDKNLLRLLFTFLQASEFNWNETKRGEKPSVYLSKLLNYCCENDEFESAYRILGLAKGASLSEVKKSHRLLAAKYHPDSGKGNEEMFVRIQKAYELIAKKK